MSGVRRIPAIQARLDRWAMWRQGGYGIGAGGSILGYLVDLAAGKRVHGDDSPPSSVVPVDNIECAITDNAVNALPPDLRQAVVSWHCARHGTLEEVAGRLGVVKTTLWRRLAQADSRIQAWLHERRKLIQ